MADSFLTVRVQSRLCALPIGQVVEVLRVPALQTGLSSVPGLRGVTQLRGQTIPVLDLALLLGIAHDIAPVLATSRLVSVRLAPNAAEVQLVGFIVDEIIGLEQRDPTTFETIHLPGNQQRIVGRFDRGFARLLDAGGLLPDEALAAAGALA